MARAEACLCDKFEGQQMLMGWWWGVIVGMVVGRGGGKLVASHRVYSLVGHSYSASFSLL